MRKIVAQAACGQGRTTRGYSSVTDGKTNEGLARPPRIPEFVANQLGATTYTRLLVFVCF
jgi:hypothetical protein